MSAAGVTTVETDDWTGIAVEAQEHLDRMVAIAAYVDGQEHPSGGDREIDAMRAEYNRCASVVRIALGMLRDAAERRVTQ